MVHDFIVTENHLLFPILPLTGSMDRAMGGNRPTRGSRTRDAYVGVMKRKGATKDIVWFRGEACYVFHVMNAWEDGNKIIANVMQFEEAPLFPHPDGRRTDPEKSRARLCRWTFDLSGNTDRFTRDYLDDITGEFPRIDDRRAGLANKHGWYACANPDQAWVGALHRRGSCRRQVSTRRRSTCCRRATRSPSRCSCRGGNAAGRRRLAAGGGVARARRTAAISRCSTPSTSQRGPVALVQLGHRVPVGFHGNWVGASQA